MTERRHEISVELEVPFHDVDSLHVVWHGHYFKYFEIARTQLFRSRQIDAGDLVERYRLVVAETRCRHGFPLRYGEPFRVMAWFHETRRRLGVQYELTNLAHGRRAARGKTVFVWTDLAGRLLLETPSEIQDALRA